MRTIRGKRELGVSLGDSLKRFTSSGEVFMAEDGTLHEVPFEVIPTEDGWLVIRIGRNTYWFNEKGEYDGSEHASPMNDELYIDSLNRKLKECVKNRGKAAEPPYFTG